MSAFDLWAAADSTAARVHEVYNGGLRTSLFTGFLTLGSFLLAVASFLLVNIKKEVYDRKSYRLNFLRQQQLDPALDLYERCDHCSFG